MDSICLVVSNWDKAGVVAESIVAAVALASLALAYLAGVFDRDAERSRRQPQVGYELALIPSEEARNIPTPPEQLPAHQIFFQKAVNRDLDDWFRYPIQKYSVVVDNGGLGPAVQVTVPYELTVWDVDDQGTRRKDDTASRHGEFSVLHVSPATQKRCPLVIETTYFPAFQLELKAPRIKGLDGKDESARWTDAGAVFRGVDVDNNQMWASLRSTVWIPSRPSSAEVVVNGVRRDPQTKATVLTFTPTARGANGQLVSWNLECHVEVDGAPLGPFTALAGAVREIRLGNQPSGSTGVLRVFAGSGTAFQPFQVP